MADTTVIGDSIRLQGNLQGDEDLTILGKVEGTIELTKTLTVELSGIVKADVSVQNAIISGVVVGNVTATDSVEITRDGRMVGDISAPRVILVDGASFRGQVDMGDLNMPRKQISDMPKPRPMANRMAAPAATRSERRSAPEKIAPEPEPVKAREPAKPAPRAPEKRAPERKAPERKAPERKEPEKTTSGRKAAAVAPQPKLMQSKKRKVKVRKR